MDGWQRGSCDWNSDLPAINHRLTGLFRTSLLHTLSLLISVTVSNTNCDAHREITVVADNLIYRVGTYRGRKAVLALYSAVK